MSTVNSEMERGHSAVALKNEIDALSARGLAKLDDKKLSEYHSSTIALNAVAQQKRIEYEWQRRLGVEQSKATMRAAWIGLVGVVVGFLLSWILQAYGNGGSPR
jgi:hypothetical protein